VLSDLHQEKQNEPRISISRGIITEDELENFELICDQQYQSTNLPE
jgi:hypothetical protein